MVNPAEKNPFVPNMEFSNSLVLSHLGEYLRFIKKGKYVNTADTLLKAPIKGFELQIPGLEWIENMVVTGANDIKVLDTSTERPYFGYSELLRFTTDMDGGVLSNNLFIQHRDNSDHYYKKISIYQNTIKQHLPYITAEQKHEHGYSQIRLDKVFYPREVIENVKKGSNKIEQATLVFAPQNIKTLFEYNIPMVFLMINQVSSVPSP